MKTIKSFLLGIFFLVLSLASIIYSMYIAVNATTIYYKANQLEPTTFTTTFVLASIILFAVGLQLMVFSLASFKLFIKHYNTYLHNKRDRHIQNRVIDDSYTQLYKDISKAQTIAEKEALIKAFYEEEEPKEAPKTFAAFMESIINK